MVIPLKSRIRVAKKDERSQKAEGGCSNLKKRYRSERNLDGQQASGSQPKGLLATRQSSTLRTVTEENRVKYEKVLEKVYEPGRLRTA